jgi:hypothetical protein
MFEIRPHSEKSIRTILLCVLFIAILATIHAPAVNADDPGCPNQLVPVKVKVGSPNSEAGCSEVDVSPGTFDQRLGVDFPTFGAIKLSYPNSSIYTNSTGDLLFTITLAPPQSSQTINGVPNATFYHSIDIYIPPDFSNLALNKVWSSYTNDYDANSMSLSKVSSTDRIAPGWWRVTVQNLIITSNLSFLSSGTPLTPRRVFPAALPQYVRIFQATSPTIAGRYFFKTFINGTSTGSANFPTIVVKASRDPAYISGTLRDIGNVDPALSGEPISLPPGFGARILASGIDYLGRSVAAQAFINSSAQGQYTLFGVAPGSYNITAYAAGFVPTTLNATVTVRVAQSLEGVDILLPHSVNITGEVQSFDSNGRPVPWGPVFGFGGRPSSRSVSIKVLNSNNVVTASTPAPFGPTLFTSQNATTFDFSIQREVGFDGRIPQDFANYTSGLTSGDYLLRAVVTQYIQLDDVYVHVLNETLVTRSVIRLTRTGIFAVTVHFRDLSTSLTDTPTPFNGTLSVTAYDQSGTSQGSNVTSVPVGSTQATVEILGFSETRQFGISGLFQSSTGLRPGTYHIVATYTSSPSFAGFANVGIRNLYFQTEDVQGKIQGFFPTVARLSFPVFKGGGIILTVNSVDIESPSVARLWEFPRAPVNFKLIDSVGNVYSANGTQPAGSTSFQFFYAGLLSSNYTIMAETYGYDQPELIHVGVTLGGNSDAILWMVQDPAIDLTLRFKTESLLAPIDSTQPYAQPLNQLDSTPARIEVYDTSGNFEGANVSYIPNGMNGIPTNTAHFVLAGFDEYFGNPKYTWAGFYDTTDGSRQNEGGLTPGDYILAIWVDGYYQSELAHVTLPAWGNVSLIVSMDRASRVTGTVTGPDYYDVARPLSWAIVDIEPGSYNTTSIDGNYQLWVPSGSYNMGVSLAGYSTLTMKMEVPASSDLRADVWLENYGGVPEFAVVFPILAVAILLTSRIVRKKVV